ncbi:cysteine hydrolase family protein [Aquihabitans sp. McL0605]|uniref:cysteine hydrolase family protein n=1 Tax=Aquihabitans sp. McL0605 TaxID=3415671 RepID=UPI003CF29C79
MTIHVEGTDPYAWPYDGRLAGGHLALVLAGWDAGWTSRCVSIDEPDRCARDLAVAVDALGGLVVRLAHTGAAPQALPVDAITIAVPGIDGFYASALDDLLRTQGRTHLLVAGHGLEAAVHSTLRSANDRGYECLLVTDASAPLTTDLEAASASTVTMSGGIFGAIGTTPAVLRALQPVPTLVPSTPQEA